MARLRVSWLADANRSPDRTCRKASAALPFGWRIATGRGSADGGVCSIEPSTGSSVIAFSDDSERTLVSSARREDDGDRREEEADDRTEQRVLLLVRGGLEGRRGRRVDRSSRHGGVALGSVGRDLVDGGDEGVRDGVRDEAPRARDRSIRRGRRGSRCSAGSSRSSVRRSWVALRSPSSSSATGSRTTDGGREPGERQHLRLRVGRALVDVGAARGRAQREVEGGGRMVDRRHGAGCREGADPAEERGDEHDPPALAEHSDGPCHAHVARRRAHGLHTRSLRAPSTVRAFCGPAERCCRLAQVYTR